MTKIGGNYFVFLLFDTNVWCKDIFCKSKADKAIATNVFSLAFGLFFRPSFLLSIPGK